MSTSESATRSDAEPMTARDPAASSDLSRGAFDTFYTSVALDRISKSSLPPSHGMTMLTQLDKEYRRLNTVSGSNVTLAAYGKQLDEVYKAIADSLVSASHRSDFHRHVNDCLAASGCRVPTDAEDLQVTTEPDTESGEDDAEGPAPSEVAIKTAAVSAENTNKARKREEAKKRRLEDEELLIKERKVRDEKNNIMSTVGPFPAPRLTIRALKPDTVLPSRNALSQRTAIGDAIDSGPSSDGIDSEPADEPAGPSATETDSIAQLTAYLSALSLNSLKKVSESAKVKLRGKCTQEEAVSEIVKAAVKMGCEKAYFLMDKSKILERVAAHANTSRTHVLAQLANNIPSFLQTLPDDLMRSLGTTLGIPAEKSTISEMWERILAMGFCAVLTHLRAGPLKRIAQELNITLCDSMSSEKHCELVVFTAFPRERIRAKQSRSLKKKPIVCFRVLPNGCKCHGDMGYIEFEVINVSQMRQDAERHYSPEFDFANLRWSLLCMANKDSLALYLCQQGTVHCKFIIAILNNADADHTVYNEGTQRFSSVSAENDWGFNNVIKFDTLLDPKGGFWIENNDSIIISVGIVLVEAAKPSASVIPNPPAAVKAQRDPPAKRADLAELEAERAVNDLLEIERIENFRKKIKNDLAKTQRDEDKQRKDLLQRHHKAFQSITDQLMQERSRIHKEHLERERREQQERSREQERLRQRHEQNEELRRKISEFTEENAELATRKKALSTEANEEKRKLESLKSEAGELDSKLAALNQELAAAEHRLTSQKERTAKLQAEIKHIKDNIPLVKGRTGPQQANSSIVDVEMLRSVQQSLATIGIEDFGI